MDQLPHELLGYIASFLRERDVYNIAMIASNLTLGDDQPQEDHVALDLPLHGPHTVVLALMKHGLADWARKHQLVDKYVEAEKGRTRRALLKRLWLAKNPFGKSFDVGKVFQTPKLCPHCQGSVCFTITHYGKTKGGQVVPIERLVWDEALFLAISVHSVLYTEDLVRIMRRTAFDHQIESELYTVYEKTCGQCGDGWALNLGGPVCDNIDCRPNRRSTIRCSCGRRYCSYCALNLESNECLLGLCCDCQAVTCYQCAHPCETNTNGVHFLCVACGEECPTCGDGRICQGHVEWLHGHHLNPNLRHDSCPERKIIDHFRPYDPISVRRSPGLNCSGPQAVRPTTARHFTSGHISRFILV